jgi:hypothetical protein
MASIKSEVKVLGFVADSGKHTCYFLSDIKLVKGKPKKDIKERIIKNG